MTKNAQYEIDYINAKIILTKKFAKAAGILNTPEYATLMQLRHDNPDFTFELREIKKKEGKKSYRNLTYKNMREYIITREGEKSDTLKEFDKILKLSAAQAGPYAYVKSWFLEKYKDEFKKEKKDAEAPEEVSEETTAKPELKLISND